MRSAYLSLSVSSTDEAGRIYTLLSDGGQIFMPMEETFVAFRFAMLRDKFGASWMVLHGRPRPQEWSGVGFSLRRAPSLPLEFWPLARKADDRFCEGA